MLANRRGMTKQQHQEVLASIGAVRTDFADLAVILKERFDRIDARLAGHDARFDAMDGRLDRMDGRLGRLEKQADRNRLEIVDHIDRVFQELSGRLEDIERARSAPG